MHSVDEITITGPAASRGFPVLFSRVRQRPPRPCLRDTGNRGRSLRLLSYWSHAARKGEALPALRKAPLAAGRIASPKGGEGAKEGLSNRLRPRAADLQELDREW